MRHLDVLVAEWPPVPPEAVSWMLPELEPLARDMAAAILSEVPEYGRPDDDSYARVVHQVARDAVHQFAARVADPARQAKAEHIPIYTIALGTPNGTIAIKHGAHTRIAPVPVSPQELAEIASVSGGRAFTAADSAKASAVYGHLATELGHKKVKRELTAGFAGGGLVLLLVGSGLSLLWLGRLV